MSMMIELRALKGASVAMGRDETRAYLVGVTVYAYDENKTAGGLYDESRAGQALLVATDGHRMAWGLGQPVDANSVLGSVPEGVTIEPHNPTDWPETIIPAEMVKNILRVKTGKEYKNKRCSEYFWLHREGLNLKAVFCDGQTVTGKAVDAAFPDWSRVLKPAMGYMEGPSMTNGLGLCSGYLADLETFGTCYSNNRTGSVQLFGKADDVAAPVLFKAKSPDNHLGYYLLMPMRMQTYKVNPPRMVRVGGLMRG